MKQLTLLHVIIALKVLSFSVANRFPTTQAYFYKQINSTYESAPANETYSFFGTVLLLECNASYPVEWIGHHNNYLAFVESRRNGDNFEDPNSYQYISKVAVYLGLPDLKKGAPLSPTHFQCRPTGKVDRELGAYVYMTVYNETSPAFSLELTSEYKSEYLNSSAGSDEISRCAGGNIPVQLTMHQNESCWNCTFYDENDRDLPSFLRKCTVDNKCKSTEANTTMLNSCFPISLNQSNKECKKVSLNNRFLPEIEFCLKTGVSETVDFGWGHANPAKMLFIHPPEKEKVYVGEEIAVHCEFSRFYFSLGSWFAVKHPSGLVEYIQAFERKPCVPGEFFAWRNKQQFETGNLVGCKWTNVAAPLGAITSTLQRKFETVGKYEIFCIGPLWNNTEWVNASLPIFVVDPPSLGPPAVEIRSAKIESVIHDGGNEFLEIQNASTSNWTATFFLDCNAPYPVEWTFIRSENWTAHSPWVPISLEAGFKLNPDVTRAETRRQAIDFEQPSSYSYTASMTLKYNGTVSDIAHFKCMSTLLSIAKLETHVSVKEIENGTALQLEVVKGHITGTAPEQISYGVYENNCDENLLYHQQVQNSDFCLTCYTTSMEAAVVNMPCQTPIQCNRLSFKNIMTTNCVQKVNVHTCTYGGTILNTNVVVCNYIEDQVVNSVSQLQVGKTHNAFFCPRRKAEFKFSPSIGQCLANNGFLSASGMVFFGIVGSAMEENGEKKIERADSPPLYTTWNDVDPSKMLYVHPIKQYIAPGESVELKCEYSRFYFSFGTWFGLRHNEGDIHYFPAVDVRPCDTNAELQQSTPESAGEKVSCSNSLEANSQRTFTSTINKLFEAAGRYQLFCFGPVWNTTEWVNSTQFFEVIKWEDPLVTSIIPDGNKTFIIGEKKRSLKCKFKGNPTPTVSWTVPEQTKLNYRDEPSFSTLIFDEVSESIAGTYTCHAKSLNYTHFLKYSVYPETRLSRTVITIIAIACVAVLAGVGAIIVKLWRTIVQQRKVLRLLTDDEVKEFKEGVPQAASSATGEYLDNAGAIEALPYDEKYEIPLDRLIINYAAILGQGEYGLILKAKLLPQKTLNYANLAMQFRAIGNAAVMVTEDNAVPNQELDVAVKVCKKKLGVESFKALLSELKVMAYIGQHDNIVSLLGAYTGNIRNRDIHIAEELCHNGSLDKFVVQHKKAFFNKVVRGQYHGELERPSPVSTFADKCSEFPQSELETQFSSTELIRWTRDIAVGVEYIHSKRVIHGDLALRNVLITKDFIAKIGDFGLSRRLGEVSIYAKTTECPLPWRSMAIESLQDLHFSVKSDMWSLGVTLWELFTLGNVPYRGMNYNSEFVKEIEDGSLRLSKPHYAPSNIYDLMLLCWENAPEDRPSTMEIRAVCDMLLSNDK